MNGSDERKPWRYPARAFSTSTEKNTPPSARPYSLGDASHSIMSPLSINPTSSLVRGVVAGAVFFAVMHVTGRFIVVPGKCSSVLPNFFEIFASEGPGFEFWSVFGSW